jgi:hypothetical protein
VRALGGIAPSLNKSLDLLRLVSNHRRTLTDALLFTVVVSQAIVRERPAFCTVVVCTR